ncbi:MAG TPA: FAD-dependent oxidoreductase, partial [Actinomycetes bacterium]
AGWGARFPSQLKLLCASRDLLEWAARRRVAAHPRVRLLDGHRVDGLRGDHGRVTGVQVHPGGGRGEARTLAADLVVDASGRGSPAPRWLAELGYRPPLETVVNAFLGYSSRTYRPPAGWQAHWRGAYVQQAPPDGTRGGVMFPMDGGRWLITLAGAARDWPPTDEAGFLEFARSLRDPILYDAIRAAEPLGPIHGIRATANRLRHYERLADRPEGFLVLGDAACAFNPVYAQGMTIACMGAAALRQTLAARRCRHPDGDLSGLARRFQQRLAKVNSAPWMLATGQDHRYPATEGAPPPRINTLLDRYLDRVVASSTEDPAARLALLETFTMLRPPTALFRPRVMARVLTRTRGRNGPAQPAASPASDAQLRVPTR